LNFRRISDELGTMAEILIIEDEVQIAEVIAAYLNRNGHTTRMEHSGLSGQKAFEEDHFDLVLLDLMLPDRSGEEICRFIRSRSRIPVIMVTAKADEPSLLYGFRVGADDYITKPFSPRELMVRIEALLRRSQSRAAAEMLELDKGRLKVDIPARKVWKEGVPVRLTGVEFDIFEKLISYPGKIFSREELIQASRGEDFDGTDRTVDSHIRNIRAKLEDIPGNPEYILTERGRGFYFHG